MLPAQTVASGSGSASGFDRASKNKAAGNKSEKAIQRDRRILTGTWNVTSMAVNGSESKKEDAAKFSVVNLADGTWSVLSEGKTLSSGTSTIDPTAKPKTIDFTVTYGGGLGKSFLGIYELNRNRRRMCFVEDDRPRPTEFASTADNQQILVEYRRAPDADAAEEREVEFDSVPPRVKVGVLKALLANIEHLWIEEVEVEKRDGRTVYEVEVVVDGKAIDVELTPGGKVLAWEEDEEDEDDDDDESDEDDSDDEDSDR